MPLKYSIYFPPIIPHVYPHAPLKNAPYAVPYVILHYVICPIFKLISSTTK